MPCNAGQGRERTAADQQAERRQENRRGCSSGTCPHCMITSHGMITRITIGSVSR